MDTVTAGLRDSRRVAACVPPPGGGEAGVRHGLDLLRMDFMLAMRLAGSPARMRLIAVWYAALRPEAWGGYKSLRTSRRVSAKVVVSASCYVVAITPIGWLRASRRLPNVTPSSVDTVILGAPVAHLRAALSATDGDPYHRSLTHLGLAKGPVRR